MGSSKSQTIGYKYFMGVHCGISLPVDAVLEFKAGGRVAWQGEVNASSTIEVNAPDLFGGDEREGGLVGTLDLLFGEPAQGTNAYLEAQQGTPQPAYRGFLSAVYRGQIAALNPYIKPWSWRVRSIKAGWFGGTCWYAEKAEVHVFADEEAITEGYFLVEAGSHYGNAGAIYGYVTEDYVATAAEIGANCVAARNAAQGTTYTFAEAFIYWENTNWDIGGTSVELGPNAGVAAIDVVPVCPLGAEVSFEENGSGSSLGVTDPTVVCTANTGGIRAMNPAHIVYQCLTDPDWGMGYPAATIDDTDFRAAADALFAEGFGLCLKWSNQTEIGEFCQIVADHAGFNIVQDRTTGLFRLVLLRDDYDVESLPTFDKSQVKVVKAQRPSLEGTINEVIVKYRDTVTQKEATTAPLQNLANIQAQGRVISQTLRFDGLPTHDLAVRVGMRELRARSTPLWRMSLEFLRGAASSLVPGRPFVVDLLDTEFAVKLVMRAGELDYGSATSGAISADCVEDVFGLPSSTYLVEQPSGWQPPNTEPQPAEATVFEVPYLELAQTLSSTDLAALPDDVGYVAAAALRPAGVSINYALRTRLGADPYEQVAVGDFAPSCLLTAVCPLEHGPTVLAVDAGTDLEDLAVGTSAWLGEGVLAELVRIDARDAVASTITVGRGCGDTVAREWPGGTRLWGFDNYAAADPSQYLDGESVDAKVAPRSTSGELSDAFSATHEVEIASRQARPYAPGLFLINSQEAPTQLDSLLTMSWAHRDRVLQADQLVSEEEASIGPEAGTTYTMRTYLNDALVNTQTAISGTGASVSPGGNGVVRIEVEAVRDGLVSWQMQTRTFNYTTGPVDNRVTVAGDRRVTVAGDGRITLG